MSTQGDRIQDRTLAEIGGKGLFTEEIEAGLLDGTLDLAVHSMKDMPTAAARRAGHQRRPAAGRPARRADRPRTAQRRRAAQGCRRRHRFAAPRRRSCAPPDPISVVVPLRGNVQTRLRKLEAGEVQATFLAMAGLIRLGLEDVVSAALEPEEMLPAVAQGAIGIECRADDAAVLGLLARINHAPTMTSITAERAFLGALDGSCRTPIAALAELSGTAAAAARAGGQPRRPGGRPDRDRRRRRELRGPGCRDRGRTAVPTGAGLLRAHRAERHARAA